ncbi:MAG: amidophosphoribosyltransferase [Deltaproteobacteria bacterium]|nr:amidophosphoribosyltransferase [Deltaproteobacteria bacterium]
MCGILGLYAPYNVYDELLFGMNTLQHRGQDNAGMVIWGETLYLKKGKGLANVIFQDETSVEGKMGLGHIRYATQGDTSLENAQPFAVNKPFGLAMIHNGNVTNFEELRKFLSVSHGRVIRSSNDIELILQAFTLFLERSTSLGPDALFAAVEQTQALVQGAFATIALLAGRGILAFNDPYGIRPLCLGKKQNEKGETSYMFTSETTTLDYLGYEKVRHLDGGEAVYIDEARQIHSSRGFLRKRKSFCVFEYIYFAREDTVFFDRLVATEREAMGRTLAKHFRSAQLNPDIVIDVPSSSYFCAKGIADELGVPYERGLIKNNYIGRSFISPQQSLREQIVKQKLNVIRSYVEGKKVAVVDDSIVRGTTSKHIVKLLKQGGAREVYFVSASPPLKFPCVYGIDLSRKAEIIASSHSQEAIRRFIGAEALIYPTLEDLRAQFSPDEHCDACFSGVYPTQVNDELFLQMEREKSYAGR